MASSTFYSKPLALTLKVTLLSLAALSTVNVAHAMGIGGGNGNNSLWVGDSNDLVGDNTFAAGTNNTINGNGSTVLGDAVNVSGENALGLGAASSVTVDSGVALGSAAVADKASGVTGKTYDGNGWVDAADTGSAWVSGLGAVSVGTADKGRQITNVSAGTEDSDAVNLAQLKAAIDAINISGGGAGPDWTQTINQIQGDVAQLDKDVSRSGANAAAIAGLHPQDFDDEHKWTGAAALGHYRGEQAIAVGVFYRPTNDFMFSLGSSFVDSKDAMFNAGISYRFGERQKYAKLDPNQMQEHVTNLTVRNRDLEARLEGALARSELDRSQLIQTREALVQTQVMMAQMAKRLAKLEAKQR